MTPGLGARTVEALAAVAEVVHGAPCRFSDPARFSLAHGGKDGHPFPVPLRVYDRDHCGDAPGGRRGEARQRRAAGGDRAARRRGAPAGGDAPRRRGSPSTSPTIARAATSTAAARCSTIASRRRGRSADRAASSTCSRPTAPADDAGYDDKSIGCASAHSTAGATSDGGSPFQYTCHSGKRMSPSHSLTYQAPIAFAGRARQKMRA